ncbi:MAG: hypothetical protein U0625_04795 [Phycisphaerales bacterium]
MSEGPHPPGDPRAARARADFAWGMFACAGALLVPAIAAPVLLARWSPVLAVTLKDWISARDGGFVGPIWLLAVVLGGGLVMLFEMSILRLWRNERRWRAARCIRCGHQTSPRKASARCPECGVEAPLEADLQEGGRWRACAPGRHSAFAALLLACAGIGCWALPAVGAACGWLTTHSVERSVVVALPKATAPTDEEAWKTAPLHAFYEDVRIRRSGTDLVPERWVRIVVLPTTVISPSLLHESYVSESDPSLLPPTRPRELWTRAEDGSMWTEPGGTALTPEQARARLSGLRGIRERTMDFFLGTGRSSARPALEGLPAQDSRLGLTPRSGRDARWLMAAGGALGALGGALIALGIRRAAMRASASGVAWGLAAPSRASRRC